MNKAVPWNVNGVGFDAREAAREAARRQGKSLGEWLHGVIADHASQLGVEEREVVGQDRVDAVTSRLERMSARAPSFERRPREDRPQERPRARQAPREYDDDREEPEEAYRRRATQSDRAAETRRSRATGPMIEETEVLLEEAIGSMERRAQRAERRTDDALASFAQMLEKNEASRERERSSVTALSQKLSDIESRLGKHDPSPIKGALARLEARLDTIGRQSAAEAAVKQSAKPAVEDKAVDSDEPIRRLEQKLNAVLDAVTTRAAPLAASVSPIALAVSHDVPPRQRRLGDAIAEIADRQRMLDNPVAPRADIPRFRERPRDDAQRERFSPALLQPSFAAIQGDIATLTTKIDDMHRAVAAARPTAAPDRGVDLARLNTQIASMTKTLGDLASRHPLREARSNDERQSAPALDQIHLQMREIRDMISEAAARPVDLEPIEHQIAALTERLNQQSHERTSGRATDTAAALAAFEERFKSRTPSVDDVQSLESLVRELGTKIEAVQAPGGGAPAIAALQEQIGILSARFERSESGLASLSSLERSMQDLFAHLEETRASVETSAAQAAREAFRLATEDGRTPITFETGRDMAALRALQDEADTRTQSTLEAVHETLEKVVDRLSVMEGDIAEVRSRPKIAETPRSVMPPVPDSWKETSKDKGDTARRTDPMMPLGGLDRLTDPLFGQKPQERDKAQTLGGRRRPSDLDEEAGRADFIAAARRAAQAAQTDASVVAMKRPAAGPRDEARAGLAAKSRDYVASHKRPVLLSLAAIFVIIGTMAVMHKMNLDDGSSEVADYRAPAKIVRALEPSAQPVKTASDTTLGALTPSTLPKSAPPLVSPIPGSDPIQTGSIPNLPSFAAQGARLAAAPPVIPAGLVAMADTGNAAADYELAAIYADGKAAPRDFKLAAKYYEKAADRGLVPAQYRLASLYEKGLGVVQDKIKAKSLYLKAAEAGNPRAMHNLAVLLADGNGKPDYEGAATWFRKAAQYGVHDSQYNLAILLARGLGVQQSLVQSYQWFAVAADQHDVDAAAKRDEVANKLSASDLSVAKALAASFHARVADVAVMEVHPPAGGWDGASMSSPLNSARAKVSSL